MKPLRVIVLSDGRPGHEKQSLGIVAALQNRTQVAVSMITLPKFSLVKTIGSTARLLLTTSGLANPLIHDADLLIGTGSGTHLSLLLYKRKYNIPAVTCMNPASYLRPFFDICFVPEHDGVRSKENIFFTVGAPNCSVAKNIHQENKGLILLGGIDLKSHHWESTKISSMIKEIILRHQDIDWTVSSSPRTPKETVDQMQVLARENGNCQFFDYRDTPKGWVEERYDESKIVWVTSDSISMLFEALSAGCSVGLLPVSWKNQDNKFKTNEDVLLRKNLVIGYDAWERDDFSWRSSGGLNEAQRCADRILQTWWPESLQ